MSTQPREPAVRDLELIPQGQVATVASFTCFSLTLFAGATYFLAPEAAPPWYYLPITILSCFGVWASFRFKRFTDFLRRRFAFVGAWMRHIDVLLFGNPGQDELDAVQQPKAIDDTGMQLVIPASPWPRSHAFRVQLMGVSAVIFSAWITMYSGGPFDSPAGQILLALPLLSPIVARRGASIVAVYLYTVVVAIVCDKVLPHREETPGHDWLIFTAVIVLGLSALIAARLKRNEVVARRLLQEARTSAAKTDHFPDGPNLVD
ncbi:hypothetical protein ABLE68_15420 [Nocardioides sp. CN2-186]|uniref:hypothetical protein n=1 Tax=Nocardioides tweenelious TaxID=3156607 RepID=UPI0032B3AB72